MPKKKSTLTPTTAAPVSSYKHDSKRARIPTQEESIKLSRREKQPIKINYAYDPALDPQLIWSGKQEHGAEFDVATVPIYVQEKIAPEAIIARLKSGASDDRQMLLFGETAEDQFHKAVEFYKHEDNWQNRLILGDSLLVMNSLLEKEGIRGRVQTIYMDPPYGIKFGSNWQVSTRSRDVKNNKLEDFIRQPEQVKAFRDTWELGIHSYLSYLRDRLIVARELLNESGSCFVQISNVNVHLIRNIMDEVFGIDNFVSEIVFLKTSSQTTVLLAPTNDYLIWYAKNIKQVKYRQLYQSKNSEYLDAAYNFLEKENGEVIKLTKAHLAAGITELDGKRFRIDNLTSQSGSGDIPENRFKWNGSVYRLKSGGSWKTSIHGLENLARKKRLWFLENSVYYKRYANDFPVQPLNNVWSDTVISGYASEKIYVVQTTSTIIERCLLMTI